LKEESRMRRVLVGAEEGLDALEGIVRKMENLVDEEEMKLSTKERDELSRVWRIVLYCIADDNIDPRSISKDRTVPSETAEASLKPRPRVPHHLSRP
jgi:hypothetical protein